MALDTHYVNEYVREIMDTYNPRIYWNEYKCADCGDWVHEDDTVWIPDMTSGKPYHVSCAPEQEDM